MLGLISRKKYKRVETSLNRTLEGRTGWGRKEILDELKNLDQKSKNPVEFKNPIFQRKLLKSEMENAKFFIYPSQAAYGETFGLAVLEAMSCGCIPIVSELPCFKDFITFGRDGFCVGEKRNIKIQRLLQLTGKCLNF